MSIITSSCGQNHLPLDAFLRSVLGFFLLCVHFAFLGLNIILLAGLLLVIFISFPFSQSSGLVLPAHQKVPLTTPSFVLFPTHCPFPSCRLLMLFVFTFLCAFGVWVYVCVLNSTHTSAFATQFLHSSLPTFYGKHPRLLVYSSKNVFRWA